ncbi:MAG: hypothetical protein KTQ49_05635 [Candidatus Omnitrophica bacterium]|nr:hypothetical protein [Candidatus Omnitrophota bacterium]
MFRKLAAVLGAVLFLVFLSLGTNYWVYSELQKRLEIRLTGKYIPSLFLPAFKLRQCSFSWEDHLRLEQGDLKVTFDPLALLFHRRLRIIVSGRDNRITFLGDWARQQGVEMAVIDSMTADVVLGRRGLSEINEAEVLSKSFQFSLRNAEKKDEIRPEAS